MLKKKFILFICLIALILFTTIGLVSFKSDKVSVNDKILSYIVDTKIQNVELYWKDDSGKLFNSILNLKLWLESKHKKLAFAMNGGMYMENYSPLGLFVQNQKKISKLNTRSGNGNFYIKPNGVFYITTDNNAKICKTNDFNIINKIKYAIQSGPMLVIDGKIPSSFKEGAISLNIRNGVGILPNNRVIFAMSKEQINFYDFAKYFKDLGCKNALYLDGYVSRTYLPEKQWLQTDGNFGVIIGVLTQK